MSQGEKGFLARWSRRKRQGADRPSTKSAEMSVEPEDAAPASEAPAPTPNGPEAEPLPRLEDLTAESDLSAFLRAGVPRELQKAALRRAWSLDPAIRDYCGPADYAFDFNNPDSIPGFASKTLTELVDELLDELAETEQRPKDDQSPSAEPSPDPDKDRESNKS